MHSRFEGYTVKVVGHLDENSNESSPRKIRDDAETFLNERSIATMGLNPYGVTSGPEIVQITQIEGLGLYLDTCAIDESLNSIEPSVEKRLICKTRKYEKSELH